jgi:hypothetical protein
MVLDGVANVLLPHESGPWLGMISGARFHLLAVGPFEFVRDRDSAVAGLGGAPGVIRLVDRGIIGLLCAGGSRVQSGADATQTKSTQTTPPSRFVERVPER